MSDIAIRVESLGKQYRIGKIERYRTLRDSLTDAMTAPFRRVRSLMGGSGAAKEDPTETIWALKNVSFEVKHGEVIGIIGRNGAGKSTLLKVLSRITEPTEGHAEIHGRVGSLLEVGTGFHPELTGRENIFLNGAILGMKKAEIACKFDEIVAFAEVEKFIDTAVKHYSSGMYVRLAFGVAAHLEPEILIVDEVLAVGDAEFQKKCLGKMGDVARDGRTVMFVSHNMSAVQRLCSRALVLDLGGVSMQGAVGACVSNYLGLGLSASSASADLSCSGVARRGTGAARFRNVRIETLEGDPVAEVQFGQPMRIYVSIEASRNLSAVTWGLSFVAADGAELQGTTAHDGGVSRDLTAGVQAFECVVNPMPLVPGRYCLRGAIFAGAELYDHVDEILAFDVSSAAADLSMTPSSHYVGYVYLHYAWKPVRERLGRRAPLDSGSRSVAHQANLVRM